MFLLACLIGAALALPFWMMRWALAWRMAGVYALTVLTSVILSAPFGARSQGYGDLIGMMLVQTMLAVLILGFAARAVWQVWKRPRPGRAQVFVDRILISWIGALVALVGFAFLGWRTVDAPAVQVHLATLFSALVPLVLAFALRGKIVRDGFWAMSATVIALTVVSGLVYPRLVLASAARIAGGDHCISLPGLQAPASSLGQLTYLTMDKTPLDFGAPHAALVVPEGPVAYWSYHLTRFAPQPIEPPVTYCPAAGQAGLVRDPGPSVATIRLETADLKVPLVYAPFRGAPDTLAITVAPPFLTPVPDPDFASAWLGLGRADTVGYLVHPWSRFDAAEHGLEKMRGGDQQEVYVARKSGKVVTQIECWDVTCLQRFSPNGADRIILDYNREHLANWRDMEDRASALFASFRG